MEPPIVEPPIVEPPIVEPEMKHLLNVLVENLVYESKDSNLTDSLLDQVVESFADIPDVKVDSSLKVSSELVKEKSDDFVPLSSIIGEDSTDIDVNEPEESTDTDIAEIKHQFNLYGENRDSKVLKEMTRIVFKMKDRAAALKFIQNSLEIKTQELKQIRERRLRLLIESIHGLYESSDPEFCLIKYDIFDMISEAISLARQVGI